MNHNDSPMNLYKTLLFFGTPGLLMYLGVSYLAPVFRQKGIPDIIGWPVIIWTPVIVLFIIIMILFFKQSERVSFKERFRFNPLSKKVLWITLIAFVVVQLLESLLAPTGAFLAQFAIFTPPMVIPDLFNPFYNFENGLSQLFGVTIKGNWWLVIFWIGWLIVNIGGEEILWRGYALPLQEKYFGKYAWLVNGLCWNILIHFFMRWNLIVLLPVSLLIPYLVQKYKNSWIGIIIHGTGNLLIFIILIPEIIS